MAPQRKHKGRALITGASSGIGAAFARRLAADGYDLILTSRDEQRLAALATELRQRHNGSYAVVAADLATPAGQDLLAKKIAHDAHLTLLVNNAGFITLEPFTTTDIARQRAMVELHVLAPQRLVHAVLPAMLARRSGAIINVSSIAAFQSGPGNVSYSASKAFLNTFDDGLRSELAGSGVQVLTLCPGWTRTEIHSRAGYDNSGVPASAWQTPEQVVHAALRALQRRQAYCFPNPGDRRRIALRRLLPDRLRPLLRRVRRLVAP